jgi:hypothetical protein
MRVLPKATYETLKQLAEGIRDRELEAALLPPGAALQSMLIEIASLRAYAKALAQFSALRVGMAGGNKYKPSGVAIELADDEQAIALAEKIAHKLNKTVIVFDGNGKKFCVEPSPRKLHS